MFITKVAFEAEKENEEILIEMAKKKTSNKGEVPLLFFNSKSVYYHLLYHL